MKINGVEFVNDNWNFYGINCANMVIKVKNCWIGSKKFDLTLTINTKRDRTTPFEVDILENNFISFRIPKTEDWEFMSNKELVRYIKDQLMIRQKQIDVMLHDLLFISISTK